ncbi:MAG: hypothetical protein U1E36_02125 [Rickettsiales bacterium]
MASSAAVGAAAAAAAASMAAARARKKREKEIKELQGQIGDIDPEALKKCVSITDSYSSASSAVNYVGEHGLFDSWPFTDTSHIRAQTMKDDIKRCNEENLLPPTTPEGKPVTAKDDVFYNSLFDFKCDMDDICAPTGARTGGQKATGR